jgi:15-cis-phytoene synthase
MTPDQQLSLAYAPAEKCAFLEALWTIDANFASVALSAREPMIARIRLAWWKENGLTSPPPDALGEAVARVSRAHSDVTDGLAGLIEAWDRWLDGENEEEAAQGRGKALFRAACVVLAGRAEPVAEQAGALWSCIDLGQPVADAYQTLDRAALRGPLIPLGILATLAVADAGRVAEQRWRPGSPMRVGRALGFALFRR